MSSLVEDPSMMGGLGPGPLPHPLNKSGLAGECGRSRNGCMGVAIVEGEGAVLWVNLGRLIATNADDDALFPNTLGRLVWLLFIFTSIHTSIR